MKLRGFAASFAALAMVTLGATGCSEAGASNEANSETAVTVESAGEDQPARITVSERAEQRLGLRTEPVRPTHWSAWSGRGHLLRRSGV